MDWLCEVGVFGLIVFSLPPGLAQRTPNNNNNNNNDNNKEEIKSEIEKQNDCVKVHEIFKYNSSKNIKVTFESQHMALQVLTKGLLLLILSNPAGNICKEIFIKILI